MDSQLTHQKSSAENTELILLGRIDGKLDALIASHDRLQDDLNALEDRVSKLERAKTWVLGAAAGLGALVSFTTKYFLEGGQP